MLKKQTIWLLTMLSLVIVLSVYYVTTPPQGNQVATVQNGEKAKTNEGKEEAKVGADQLFTQLRLDIEDERSAKKEELQTVIASADVTIEQKNEARDEMTRLNDLSAKEVLLETLLKTDGYKDALVRVEGENVKITVLSKEHSPKQANKIIQLAKDELGDKQVAVTFQK